MTSCSIGPRQRRWNCGKSQSLTVGPSLSLLSTWPARWRSRRASPPSHSAARTKAVVRWMGETCKAWRLPPLGKMHAGTDCIINQCKAAYPGESIIFFYLCSPFLCLFYFLLQAEYVPSEVLQLFRWNMFSEGKFKWMFSGRPVSRWIFVLNMRAVWHWWLKF